MHRTVEVWTEADIARVQFHRETPSFAITSGLKFLKLQLNSYLQLSYRDKDEIDICTIYVSWNGVRPDLILPTLGKESGITPTRPPVHYCHFIRCFKATDKKVILNRLLDNNTKRSVVLYEQCQDPNAAVNTTFHTEGRSFFEPVLLWTIITQLSQRPYVCRYIEYILGYSSCACICC